MERFPRVVYKGGITTGATVTSGASSANVALPTDGSGRNPRHCMLSGTGSVHVKLGIDNTVTATANDLMIGTAPVVLDTGGAAFIAYIQETAAAKLNIAPLEE